MIGQTVSHYRIEEKLGEGGMGVVYRAEDTRLGRQVALKALAPAYARDPNRRKRFQHEARAAARLNHPGIAAVYEMEEVGEDLYIVYEYVRGENLRAVVNRGGVKLEGLLDIATDIAAALAAAHAQGVVHRDLKPENIARTPDGNTKILDFGLARFQPERLDQETASHLTDAGAIVGTVAYMSPEQLEGKEVDFRTDIFSFGVLLYELATGVRPFEGGSPASTIARILTGEAVPMRERNPITPAELDRIVRKCLRKSPEERYQSTRDLQVDLENLRRDSGSGARRAVAAGELREEEPSLLRAMFARIGVTPRRWWELQQLFAVFVYAPIAFSLALKSSVTISSSLNTALASNWHGWQGMIQVIVSESPTPKAIWSNFGLAFFLTLILLLTTTVATHLYLVWLAAFSPVRLLTEVRRIHAVQRAVYAVVALQFMFAGFFLLRVTARELIFGAGLGAFGLFTLLAVSYAEPKMLRAAFPAAAAPPVEARPPARPRRWPLALGLVAVPAVVVLGVVLALDVGGWRERLARSFGTGAPRIESIAVLPLENLSRDPEQEYFADGMTEALIADLAQISALRVISRTSVMQYKGTRKPLPEIARELNVDAVVEGSVQRAGDRVLITAQLIHAPTDKHLWAQSYERSLEDVFALQGEVAQAIAQQIRITLTAQEEARLASARQVHPASYEAYLRGKFSFHKHNRDKEQADAAVGWFEQAVQLDPNSALAHAALAEAYTSRFFSHDPRQEWEERAHVHIEKALALDPNLAEAYVARGDLAWTLANHFPHERAIQDYRQALELNPNLSDGHFSLGLVYTHIGLLDEAMKEFQTALALDPGNLDARYRIPRIYLYRQDYEAALGEFERSPELSGVWYWQRAVALFYLKRTGEAFAVVDKLRREFPENEDVASTYAVLLAAQGRRREAEEQIRTAVRAGEGKSHFHHAAYNIASAYALMGRKREALQWLRRTAEEGLPCYPLFAGDPNLDKLRGDPEFETFLKEMKTQWEERRAALFPGAAPRAEESASRPGR